MCGIWGYECPDKYEPRLDIVIPIMSLYMESRGSHSWGWSDGVEIVKDSGPISEGINPSLFGAKRAMFHTRYATTGAKTKENAHPWKFGEGENLLIGMHNGMVNNDTELNRRYDRKFEVDSMHIFQHIVEGKSLKEISGYGAVCFFQKDAIWAGRFNSGQLSIAKTQFGIIWASTQESIEKAMKMAGLKIDTFYRIDDEKMYRIQDGQVWNSDFDFKFGSRYSSGYTGGYTNTSSKSWNHDWNHDWRKNRETYTANHTPNKGRLVSGVWESGKWFGSKFVFGSWMGEEFTPDPSKNTAKVLKAIRKEAKKDRSRLRRENKGKVITINEGDDDFESCVLCSVILEESEEVWDTPLGDMCDSCARICFKQEEGGEEDSTTEVKTIDDPFSETTVREFLKLLSPSQVPENADVETGQTSCDECSKTLNGDEKMYVDKNEEKVTWILCPSCYTALTTPYKANTEFNFPSA